MNKHQRTATRRSSGGFTLVEVLIASVILAIIGTISYQSLSVTILSKDVVEDNLEKLSRIDRAWVLIEGDLRNALSHVTRQSSGAGTGETLQPMVVENGGDYWMIMLRGGHANPLNFLRTELIRIGYRIQDEALWRDVWYNLSSVDIDQARQQKIIDNVERVEIRVLPHTATSFTAGPWLDRWPQVGGQTEQGSLLPMAIEVTIILNSQAEISRLFSLVKGE